MKSLVPAIALAVALSAGNATADEPPAGSPPPPEGRPKGERGDKGRFPPPPVLKALDPNGDKTIDADEIAGAADALKALDKDGDGKLTPEELRPPRPEGKPGGEARDGGEKRGDRPERPEGPPPGDRPEGGDRKDAGGKREGPGRDGKRPPPPLFSAIDPNGDRTIDADEIAGTPEALRKLDKNEDGKLTAEELFPKPPKGKRGPDAPGGEPPKPDGVK